jgi:hypothetical protein
MPPDRRGGAPTPESARHHHRRQSFIKDQHPQGIAGHRHLGRYASGWRDGFTAGAVDALRVVGRRLPVETWHVIEALADQYELAADD